MTITRVGTRPGEATSWGVGQVAPAQTARLRSTTVAIGSIPTDR